MKFKWDKKYLYWGITALLVVICSILFYFFMDTIGSIFKSIFGVFKVLTPVLYGIIIAYLLNPAYMFFATQLRSIFGKKAKNKALLNKITNGFGIVISILLFLVVIVGLLWIVIPQLFESIKSVVAYIPEGLSTVEEWIKNYFSGSPQVETAVASIIDKMTSSITNWSQNELLPLSSVVNNLTAGITNFLIFLKDFLLGLVIAIYLLGSKKTFINQTKRLTYSVLGIKKANKVMEVAKYTDNMMKKTIGGKLLTSLFVSIITFIVMTIFKWPYPLLISVVVGVTNIIPFFGPWIGGIPSLLLILMVNPAQAIYFGIFTFVLQTIEGNYIHPKIVGHKTGISSFWVLFSILLFGGLFGIIGMIIGVPIFAIIYHFTVKWFARLSEKRNVPVQSEKYEDISYIEPTDKKDNK